MKKIIELLCVGAAALSLCACNDFLDRPTVDNYNVSNFYKTDDQVEQGVNYIYNSPWYDFQRAFIKIGEVMSGNMYWGGSPYLDFTTNGTDVDLINMSYSLWAVNGHCNTVINNIINSEGPSKEAKMQYIGEALTWKAFAYFFMVRTFGEVPIVHDNTELLSTGEYNSVSKVEKADVYEYIIPVNNNIDKNGDYSIHRNTRYTVTLYVNEATYTSLSTKAGVSTPFTITAKVTTEKLDEDEE